MTNVPHVFSQEENAGKIVGQMNRRIQKTSAATIMMELDASAARDVRQTMGALKLMEYVRLIQNGVHLEHMDQLDAVEDAFVASQSGHQSLEDHVILLMGLTAQRMAIV
ncbi:unnamed protein product [Meganyctiphanes norvegica]|uniref:Uncharacterized protein n=1 Tax=Meganyctiphanes norvegica TaxID=48144 RepID=A0AAV2S3A6_MEGNR